MTFEVVLLRPAVEFLESLDPRLRAKAFRTIELLEQFGPRLPLPHSRKLTSYELWELRVQLANSICRLFYFRDSEGTFVITSGFIKKSVRPGQSEITKALRLKNQYARDQEI